THFLALERLGAEITVGTTYKLEARETAGTDTCLSEPSVTATETARMAAFGAHGRTVLRNAACEPHVQDLVRFLAGLGATVDGIGTNTLTIEGRVPSGGAPPPPTPFAIGPDHIEIGSFLGLAAVTNGAVTIDGVRPADLRATLMAFDRLGVRPRLWRGGPHRAVIAGPVPLRGQVVESPDIRAGMAMLLAALAAQGDSVIHNIGQIERGYERIDERLRTLGAQIERLEGQADRR